MGLPMVAKAVREASDKLICARSHLCQVSLCQVPFVPGLKSDAA